MAETKWFKAYNDIFDNRKIKQLRKMSDGDMLICIWFQFLALASQINCGGAFYLVEGVPYTQKMFADEFDRSLKNILSAIDTFKEFKMLEESEGVFCISNWEKYQSTERLEKIKEQNRNRKQRQRNQDKQRDTSAAKQDMKVEENRDCHAECHADVTPCHATELELELELELDIDKDKDNKDIVATASKDAAAMTPFSENSFEYKASEYLKNSILKILPKAKLPDDLQRWAIHIDRMIRLDNRSEDEIWDVMKFAVQDTFWQTNILSTKKLREQFDTLYAQMQRKKAKNTGQEAALQDSSLEWIKERTREEVERRKNLMGLGGDVHGNAL